MDIIDRNQDVLKKIDTAVSCIWENPQDMREQINDVILEINEIIAEFLNHVEEYTALGIEIPVDVIVSQLQNMEEGMKWKDNILLADTLEYEIQNTILFYNDILTAIQQEQEGADR